jgi:hypothetical protein
MGVAIDMVALAEPGLDHRVLLNAAGYVLNPELELWINGPLDRAIDARIAAKLTRDQLTVWIAAGC